MNKINNEEGKYELTLNSPPHPSSNSRRYPSIEGPRCPQPRGGCQAIVTLLFSALHSSGTRSGAPGARIRIQLELNFLF